MVVSGFASHIACTTWDTHSHPALVRECVLIRSCGTLNVRTDLLSNYWLPPALRITSPTTIPRTPPEGLRKAVIRPILTASTTWSGTLAVTRCSPNLNNQCNMGGLAKKGLKCSLVIPEGPAAALLRAVPKLHPKRASSNLNYESGVWWTISSGKRVSELSRSSFQSLESLFVPGCQLGPFQSLSRGEHSQLSEHESSLTSLGLVTCVPSTLSSSNADQICSNTRRRL